ncbi:uncharacterized protein SPSK_10187 [Sporothrix schenckii 1099-18]|uniref:Uncharacterized protein n=1 Tax=Sporothrix schenckii 1099-18 TaxID=1397361 RepID=A0A0F2M749_SPOSC|nr:uncharacterized protein SPSK_10187 [Sporothrix schenckii 1099-18]KJR84650.1 hypothetical protein SPSK_10187 [Sporothrix schenckii 1099-18]
MSSIIVLRNVRTFAQLLPSEQGVLASTYTEEPGEQATNPVAMPLVTPPGHDPRQSLVPSQSSTGRLAYHREQAIYAVL